MTRPVYACIGVCLLLGLSRANAQQPDSTRRPTPDSAAVQVRVPAADSAAVQVRRSVELSLSADSAAIRAFVGEVGPAESIFSLTMPPPFGFRTGVYRVSDPDFPLLNSPDSLVRLPMQRARRQRRVAKVTGLVSIVPTAVFMYSVTSIVFSLGAAISGRRLIGIPSSEVLVGSAIGMGVGLVATTAFNLTAFVNLTKAVKRHNRWAGRRMPTLFNLRGL